MSQAFAYRLKALRVQHGLSQQALAVQLGISKQMISQYEKSAKHPGSTVLIAISKLFGRSPGALLKPISISLDKVDFRKKSKLRGKKIEAVKMAVLQHLEPYLELEEILGLEARFSNPLSDAPIQQADVAQAEKAAEQLQQKWELGFNPIPNVYEMLEAAGIKVIEVEAEDSFDGLSTLIDDKVPVIVINKNRDIVRKRFTAMHELGHLLLVFGPEVDAAFKEKACNRFAGAMLLPAKAFLAEIGPRRHQIGLPELIAIKEYYGISLAAIVYRGKDLGIFPDAVATRFWKSRNQNPDLKQERGFGHYAGEERAHRFNQLLSKALAEGIISFSKAAELTNQSLSELRSTYSMI